MLFMFLSLIEHDLKTNYLTKQSLTTGLASIFVCCYCWDATCDFLLYEWFCYQIMTDSENDGKPSSYN